MAFGAPSRVLDARPRSPIGGSPTQRVRRSVNALDIIVIAVIALSALFAFARGFVKEALSIGAWLGAFRGVVLACLGFIALSWAIPKEADWPGWVKAARTRSFLASGAEVLKSLVPSETRERGAAAAAEAQHNYEQAKEAEQMMRALASPAAPAAGKTPTSVPPPTYKPGERRDMDRLIQSL